MTEEEFKKVMTKATIFIVFALIVLVIIGIVVFNKSNISFSVFANQKEIDNYKKKLEEKILVETSYENVETLSDVNEEQEENLEENNVENVEEVAQEPIAEEVSEQ